MKTLSQHINDSFSVNEAFIPFEDLTVDDAIKMYPVSDKTIMKIAKDSTVQFKKKVSIDEIYTHSQTKKYDTFLMVIRTLDIKFHDVIQSDVTSMGTYHEKKGKTLEFNFRSMHRKGTKNVEFTINCKFDNPGGMSIYDSKPVKTAADVKQYIQSIVNTITF